MPDYIFKVFLVRFLGWLACFVVSCPTPQRRGGLSKSGFLPQTPRTCGPRREALSLPPRGGQGGSAPTLRHTPAGRKTKREGKKGEAALSWTAPQVTAGAAVSACKAGAAAAPFHRVSSRRLSELEERPQQAAISTPPSPFPPLPLSSRHLPPPSHQGGGGQ